VMFIGVALYTPKHSLGARKKLPKDDEAIERTIQNIAFLKQEITKKGETQMKTILKQTLLLLIVTSGVAIADADGSDYYKVEGVASNDVLNIRTKANPHADKVGEIPPRANCVKNLGCKGGLTMSEFTELSKKEQAVILRKCSRWC